MKNQPPRIQVDGGRERTYTDEKTTPKSNDGKGISGLGRPEGTALRSGSDAYQEDYPEAMKCLASDLEESLTALRFPESHRKRIRTTNLLERLFGEGRRRSKIVPRFMSESSGLSLIFAVLVDASAHWRGVKINAAVRDQLEALKPDSKQKETTLKAA